MQTSPPVHVTPQAPQFDASVCVSTHDPPQSTSGCVQLAAHAPPLHTCVALHAAPHEPQS